MAIKRTEAPKIKRVLREVSVQVVEIEGISFPVTIMNNLAGISPLEAEKMLMDGIAANREFMKMQSKQN